jgi:hypothetical protein
MHIRHSTFFCYSSGTRYIHHIYDMTRHSFAVFRGLELGLGMAWVWVCMAKDMGWVGFSFHFQLVLARSWVGYISDRCYGRMELVLPGIQSAIDAIDSNAWKHRLQ